MQHIVQLWCSYPLLHVEVWVPLPHNGCIFWSGFVISGMYRGQSEKEGERKKAISFPSYEKFDASINKGTSRVNIKLN